MAGLIRRESKEIDPFDVFNRLDQMFGNWMRAATMRPSMLFGQGWMPEEMIKVDEYRENGDLVVRAELPGIDPDRDVELTVSDGMLHIEAERREEKKGGEKGYVRHELRYGKLSRVLPLPEGVSESDIKASYKDGLLEIRIPSPQREPAKKIEISKS